MNWTLLHRYLSQECDPEEMLEVEDWLHSDPRNQEFMNSLKKIWMVEPNGGMEMDARAAWQSFRQRIEDYEKKGIAAEETLNLRSLPIDHSTIKTQKRYGRVITVSAAAAAVVMIALIFYQMMPSIPTKDHKAVNQVKMQQVVTERGQRTTFRLHDGTQVQLNAASRLQIPSDFGASDRIVYLDGEAYFDVAHNPGKPFVVYSGESFTRVLGTQFGVRAYSEELQIQVVVSEGQVAMGSTLKNDYKKITPNQIGILLENGKTVVSRVENIDRYLGWSKGQLVFDDIPMGKVIPQMERWFDIEISLDDPGIAERRLKATFGNEPMTEVLNVIILSLDLRYERKGREIIFFQRS